MRPKLNMFYGALVRFRRPPDSEAIKSQLNMFCETLVRFESRRSLDSETVKSQLYTFCRMLVLSLALIRRRTLHGINCNINLIGAAGTSVSHRRFLVPTTYRSRWMTVAGPHPADLVKSTISSSQDDYAPSFTRATPNQTDYSIDVCTAR